MTPTLLTLIALAGQPYAPYPARYYNQAVETKTVFVAAERDPYYSNVVGEQARQQQRIAALESSAKATESNALADTLARLAAAADRIAEAAARLGQPAPITPLPAFVPPPPPVVPPPPAPNPGPTATLTPAGVKAFAVFGTSCKSCHAGASAAKSFAMFDDAGRPAVLSPIMLAMIQQEIDSGDMPKDKPALDGQAYDDVRSFVLENKDAIAAALKACLLEKSK